MKHAKTSASSSTAGGSINPRDGYGAGPYGLNHIVAVSMMRNTSGMGPFCKNPHHKHKPNCRKRVGFTAKGVEYRGACVAMQLLRVWLAWGVGDPDRQTRVSGTWDSVLAAHAEGQLLDVEDVTEFP